MTLLSKHEKRDPRRLPKSANLSESLILSLFLYFFTCFVTVDISSPHVLFVKCSVFKSLYSFVHSQIAYKIKYFSIVQTLLPCAFFYCMPAMVANGWQCHPSLFLLAIRVCAGANQRSRMLFQVAGPAIPSALSPFFF